jgi:hypothetical protein
MQRGVIGVEPPGSIAPVAYLGQQPDDTVSILRAGKNVVSCSVVPLVFPDAVDTTFTGPLRAA